jgi:hypothetical protein
LAQQVTAGQRYGGTCDDGDRGEQRVEDHVALTSWLCWEPMPVLLLHRYLDAARPAVIERLIP